jgi:hypothetical protein
MSRTPRKTQWWMTLRKCDGHCWYCGFKPEVLTDLTVDHATPVSQGGHNADWNLLPACAYCNHLKDNQTIHQFRKVVKHLVIRKLMTLGYVGGDLSRLQIRFYGEGYDSVLGF